MIADKIANSSPYFARVVGFPLRRSPLSIISSKIKEYVCINSIPAAAERTSESSEEAPNA